MEGVLIEARTYESKIPIHTPLSTKTQCCELCALMMARSGSSMAGVDWPIR